MRKIENVIKEVEVYLAILLVAFICIISFMKLIMRNFMSSDAAVDLSDDISKIIPHLILLLGFLGSSIGISRRETIQMDVLTRLYPPKFRALFIRLGYIMLAIMLAFTILFAYNSVSSMQDVKYWIYCAYIPVFAILLIKSIFVQFHPEDEDVEEHQVL
ncbi:MAG: TRAP transporter small permease subunit [Candidatus Hydrogenedentota bacterium]|nr:MAG: TRAP transporter small permease subunit [Candidatus Hydrogenedentota bacterium]